MSFEFTLLVWWVPGPVRVVPGTSIDITDLRILNSDQILGETHGKELITAIAATDPKTGASGRDADSKGMPGAPSALEAANAITARIQAFVSEFTAITETGAGTVAYTHLKTSGVFHDYVWSTRELRRLELSQLSTDERTAFCLNLYNVCVVPASEVFRKIWCLQPAFCGCCVVLCCVL